jgi:hypothetical protein
MATNYQQREELGSINYSEIPERVYHSKQDQKDKT